MCVQQNSEPTMDVLIVGQGIAGSLLAYVLHKRGLRVKIVDDGHKTSASVVAAGMINPIQGQKLNLIWEAEHSMPAALDLYHELEAQFGTPFFFPQCILKLLKNDEQAAALQKGLQDPAFAAYIGAVYPPDSQAGTESAGINANTLHAPFGSFEILGGGYLDTLALLNTLRAHFRREGLLVEQCFTHADLQTGNPAQLHWQGLRMHRIIFAEGWRILDNPFFAHYAFIPTKGQILSVQSAKALPRCVINCGHWLVPQGESHAWAGATYERGQTDCGTTDAAEHEILSQVQNAIPDNPLQVQSRRAGIRLATPDHIPRVGFLPADERIGVFSAFSSKGNCLAPYLAGRMAEYLQHGTALPPRADISTKKPAAQSRQV